MLDRRLLQPLGLVLFPGAGPRAAPGDLMYRTQIRDPALRLYRQAVVRIRGAREVGIAERHAVFHGHLQRIEQGRAWRTRGVRHVRMPNPAGVGMSDIAAVL